MSGDKEAVDAAVVGAGYGAAVAALERAAAGIPVDRPLALDAMTHTRGPLIARALAFSYCAR